MRLPTGSGVSLLVDLGQVRGVVLIGNAETTPRLVPVGHRPMGVSAGPARGGDEAVERVIGEPPNQGITGGDQCSQHRVGDRACRRIAPYSPTGRAVHRLYDVAHVVVGVGDVL